MKKTKIVGLVPSGDKRKWSMVNANEFDVVWSDGTVGVRYNTYQPSSKELLRINKNASAVIQKLEEQIQLIRNVQKLLSNKKVRDCFDKQFEKMFEECKKSFI